MEAFLEKLVSVITNDGRNIIGKLIGHDNMANMILSQAIERIYSPDSELIQSELGLYIIRGDNVAVVGLIDEDVEQRIDYKTLRANPLKPVTH
jgi:U6 snRNA-associated Sm-like protein LSm8